MPGSGRPPAHSLSVPRRCAPCLPHHRWYDSRMTACWRCCWATPWVSCCCCPSGKCEPLLQAVWHAGWQSESGHSPSSAALPAAAPIPGILPYTLSPALPCPPLPGGCTTPWSTGGRRSPSHLRWARSSTSLFRWGASVMWWHPRVAGGHQGCTVLCGAACYLANSVGCRKGQPLPAPASRSPVSPSVRPACSLRHPIALPAPLRCVQPFIPEFGSHHNPEPGHAHHSELEKVGGQLLQRLRLTGLAAPEQCRSCSPASATQPA